MRALSFVALIAAFLFAAANSGAQPPAKDDPDPKAKADPKAKTEPKAKGKGDAKDKDGPAVKHNRDVKAGQISLGSHISGPKVSKDDLKDRVILLDYWGI